MKTISVFNPEIIKSDPLINNGILTKNEYKLLWRFTTNFYKWIGLIGSMDRTFNKLNIDRKRRAKFFNSFQSIYKKGSVIVAPLTDMLIDSNSKRTELEKMIKEVNILNKKYAKLSEDIENLKS